MSASGIMKLLCRNTAGKGRRCFQQLLASKSRSLCVSSASNMEYIYKSPFPDVDIPDVSVTDYVTQKTQKYQDRVALVCGETGEELRYGDLWENISSVATSLSRLGVTKGSTVALVAPNCPEFVIAFMGAAATGATITTVNSHFTTDEVSRQLQDGTATVVICHPDTATVARHAAAQAGTAAAGGGLTIINTHRCCALPGELCLQDMYGETPFDASSVQITPGEDVLALPYSSGTTGMPKGVMLTHTNIVANLQQLNAPGLLLLDADQEEQEVNLGVLPMFHIYGMVPCLLMSLITGSKCVTFTKFDPQLYVASMLKYKPTVLHTVPPILNFLAHTPQVEPHFLHSVRALACGAAPLGEAIVHQVLSKFTHGLNIQEGYGMTEMSPVSHMTPGMDFVASSCGKPIPNTLAKLVHLETGESLGPEDEGGELCIKGPQNMKGYYNNPSATESTIDKDGWLHTGDIAHIDDKGNFYIVDRLKELIKVKGFQVAPAELEDLLRTYPGVADVAVIGVPDDKAGELPRAYIVKEPECDNISAAQINEFVSSKVSAHKKLAGGIMFVMAIPKSTTGKILRKDLRAEAMKQ